MLSVFRNNKKIGTGEAEPLLTRQKKIRDMEEKLEALNAWIEAERVAPEMFKAGATEERIRVLKGRLKRGKDRC